MAESSTSSSRYRTDSLFSLSYVLPVYDYGSPGKAALTLLAFTGAKSILIPLSFHLARYLFNPFYSDPNCLLRLVNTTAPEHYEKHIYWRRLQYDDSCVDLKPFVLDQFNDYAQAEFKAWQVLGPAMFFTAVASVLYPFVVRNAKMGSTKAEAWRIVAASLLPCHFTMAAMFMLVHFEMDLTYLVGNIQHHADISRFTDKSNASTVDTLPQGFLLTYFFNIAWLFVCFKYLFHYSRRLQHYSNASLISALFLFSGQVSLKMLKEDHPKFHAVAQENWRDAIPFSFEYRAYHHVFRHHVDGDSFGSSWLFDPLFSKMFQSFAFIHHDIFGIHSATSWGHYAVVCAYDTVQGLAVLGIILGMFLAASKVTQWLERGGGVWGFAVKVGVSLGFVFWLFINGAIFKNSYDVGGGGGGEGVSAGEL
ncbi:hypothetical protein TeGR_g6329 [Tetraparma gracilis]|uniref:Uncharacterized protein n=1 Tax=Tetraparma gracilis TaxID=2962635 RepID=A0ABQ6N020_9STRA|nr:hypothetical protein TeGR_g6329 [Tetraparma gracilis]